MDHPHFVLTCVKDESELIKWICKIKQSNLECSIWKEPDMSNEITAVAVQPVYGDQRRFFRKLKLLGVNNDS